MFEHNQKVAIKNIMVILMK